MPKTITLKFRAVNKDIFEAIVSGKKKIETRAGTSKYQFLAKGDMVVLSCGTKKVKKLVGKVEHFASVPSLVEKHKPRDINPTCRTLEDLTDMYHSFPGYKEKIPEHGIVALTLKPYADTKS